MDVKIYILFACNEWKDYGSMRLIGATTSVHKLRQMIAQEITLGNMGYDSLDLSTKAQLHQLHKDAQRYTIADINNSLSFGYIAEVYDGV